MTETVPSISIVFMVITCMISFGMPIALFLYLRLVKKRTYIHFLSDVP